MTYEAAIAERIQHYKNKQQRKNVTTEAVMAYQEVINDLTALLTRGPERWDPPRLHSPYDDITMVKVG